LTAPDTDLARTAPAKRFVVTASTAVTSAVKAVTAAYFAAAACSAAERSK
jgi:hypothetical protein